MSEQKTIKPIFARPYEEPVALGEIIETSGARATVLIDKRFVLQCPQIGSLLTVNTKTAIVLCLITSMKSMRPMDITQEEEARIIEVELVGELARESDGYLRTFQRGVSQVPKLGDRVHVPSNEALSKAYQYGPFDGVRIGVIHQNRSIPAMVKVEELLTKHFAVVGSTGTGKSCTTALILRQVLERHPNAHVLMLDPHSEYGTCFGEMAELVRPADLCLPFWVLNFEEIVEVLIGDPKEYPAEVELLRDLIPNAKRNYGRSNGKRASAGRLRERHSVDVPVPYRISDLISLLEEQMGRLENKNGLGPLKSLKSRIESVTQDVRYGFMFGSMTVEDNLKSVLKRLFRLPVDGKPVTVLQLTGLPAEIVNVIVSVLARLAFDLALWSDGKVPMTFVCEEAHRYVPRDSKAGFEPTKRAIARIAKEGRKYGVGLCIVSQRPGDIDPTILSQCSTLFTMRLSNELDQKIVRSALSDAAKSLLEFLPSLGTRETIIFGEGVTLPSRVLLSKLPASALPRGYDDDIAERWNQDLSDDNFLDDIISRWRMSGQTPSDVANGSNGRGNGAASAEPPPEAEGIVEAPEQQQAEVPRAAKAAEAEAEVEADAKSNGTFGKKKPKPKPEKPDLEIDKEVFSPALDRLAERLRSMND